MEAPVLAHANFALPFILEVDASHSGLGAVLSQEQDGKIRPIAYASQGLKPAERNMNNYSSLKLEFLALKWAMTEKFREYLLGQKCVVYTDNNPLSHLSTAKLGAVEQRWASEQDGVLYRKVFSPDGDEVLQLVLPLSLKNQVLNQLHHEHGHQGVERTVNLVWQRCYWPGMHQDVKR